ncbi:MAG: hypothetical protein ACP5HG_16170, partial [Anaerolineae bacterium]
YLLWRVWADLTGTSELAMRSTSALAGILAVAAGGRLVARLTRNRRHGLIALGLFAVATPLLWASREMRMYGPLLGLTLLADMALVEALVGPPRYRRRWAWAWGALTLGALYTVVLSGFWLIGQGIFVLVFLFLHQDRAARRAYVVAFIGPALTAALLFLPWLIPALGHLGENRGYWPGTLTPAAFFTRALQGVTLFRYLEPAALARYIGGGMVILAVLGPILAGGHLLAALWALFTALPPLMVASVLFRNIPKWDLQHTVIFAPSLVVALAAAWPQRQQGRFRRWLAAAVRLWVVLAGAAFVVADANLLLNPAYANDDWRGLVAYVEAHRADDEVVIIETGSVAPAWRYYGSDERLLPLPEDPLLDVTHVLHYENTAPLLNAHLGGASGVWVVRWLAEVTDPTDIVGTLLADVGERTALPAFHGLELRHYALTETPNFRALPSTTAQPDVALFPGLRLWGATLPAERCPADEPIPVRTWWTTSDPAVHEGRSYQVSLRVYDAAGNPWGQRDGTPGGGDYRPERWPPDTPVLGAFDVPLLTGAPCGTYTVTALAYTLVGERSPEVTLGTVTLDRPESPPAMPEEIEPVELPDGATSLEVPLKLLGLRLETGTVHPCESLRGRLFWEITTSLPAAYRVRLSVGDQRVELLPAAEFAPDQWQPGDRFLTQFKLPISCRALATEAPLTVALVEPAAEGATGEELAVWRGPTVRIDVERVFAPPASLTPRVAEFGDVVGSDSADGIAFLRGFRLEPDEVATGEPFRIVLYWQAAQPTDVPYSVFVHITRPGELAPLVTQHDGWPGSGAKPTYTWVPGEVIADPHPFDPLPPGRYDVRVGLYAADGDRLPVYDDGVELEGDALLLTTLELE